MSFKWILLSFNFITIIVVYLHKRKNKKPKEHNILFLTAHPDDECMFFRPTIESLRNDYIIHILSLTGKGTPREDELAAACKHLQVPKWSCLNHEKLIDGMK